MPEASPAPNIDSIAYFFSDGGLLFAMDKSGKKLHLDGTLETLEQDLNPANFFRINRKLIIGLDSINKISQYFNNRLKLELTPAFNDDTIVSRERVQEFKSWLDR